MPHHLSTNFVSSNTNSGYGYERVKKSNFRILLLPTHKEKEDSSDDDEVDDDIGDDHKVSVVGHPGLAP